MVTKKKAAPKKVVAKKRVDVEVKAPKVEKKVISKSVEKRVKLQKEATPKYPTVDGLKVVEILDGSTPTAKNCMMEDGTTRFVEIERFK